jgi:hypothetical protein
MASVALGTDGTDSTRGNGGNMCMLTSREEREAGAGTLDHVYRIVQFDGPVREPWKQSLAEMAEIFDYVPDFAFIVRVPAGRVAELCGLGHVRWVGLIEPDMKIGDLGTPGEAQKYRVNLFPGEDVRPVVRRIESMGGTVLESNADSESANRWGASLAVEMPRREAAKLAGVQAVRRVEKVSVFKAN